MVIASTWQEARARVWNHEPRAEFVTMPGEVAEALIINDEVMSEREFADLRAACKWSESRLRERPIERRLIHAATRSMPASRVTR